MKSFMRQIGKSSALVVSMLLLFMSSSTFAGGVTSYLPSQHLTIQKPVFNGSIIGEALTGWISSDLTEVMSSAGIIYGQFGLTIFSTVSNISYSESGNIYTVYNIDLPGGEPSGIGFILRTYSQDCGIIIGCANTGPHIQNTNNGYKQFRDEVAANFNIHYRYETKFIATSANIRPGTYHLPGRNVGYSNFFTTYESTAAVILPSFTLKYEQSGCTASLSPAVVNMGVVSPLLFAGVGSTVTSNAPVTVSLQCSSPDIGVLATMTDQNNPSNSTNILQLTPGSTATATGVGVQFLKDGGSAVIYGRDSSFVDSSSAAQWRVKDKSTLSTTAQFVLTPQYIQTANITPGEANAVASITFAYH